MLGNIVLLIIGLVVGLLIGWYYWGRRISEHEAQVRRLQASVSEKERSAKGLQASLKEREAEIGQLRARLEPDDLTPIEGIGSKIENLLRIAGIYTYAQLATTDVDRLRQILAEADLAALADPTTWPEQAKLAADGKWEALEALKEELKGGRRE
jgi:predicted flap endonuclease-1-like 5' DNA nuclease